MHHPATRAERRALVRKHPPRKYWPLRLTIESKAWPVLYIRRFKLMRARRLGRL